MTHRIIMWNNILIGIYSQYRIVLESFKFESLSAIEIRRWLDYHSRLSRHEMSTLSIHDYESCHFDFKAQTEMSRVCQSTFRTGNIQCFLWIINNMFAWIWKSLCVEWSRQATTKPRFHIDIRDRSKLHFNESLINVNWSDTAWALRLHISR